MVESRDLNYERMYVWDAIKKDKFDFLIDKLD